MLLGAALGTLPDLDVLVPHTDAIDAFTLHRSYSHSLFVLSLVSLPVAAIAQRLVRPADGAGATFGRWWLACWAVLITHALLDGFTVYGTQLFWPIPVPPVAIGSIFIIDPLYTLPLLIGLAYAWRHRERLRRAHVLGLSFSCAWLLATMLLQQLALADGRRSLQAQGIAPDRMIAVPLPFGVLWRLLALDGDDVLEGWVSHLDGQAAVRFTRVPLGLAELGEVRDSDAVQRMHWFTAGFVSARETDADLVLTDLRIGTSRQPIFAFDIGDVQPGAASRYRLHRAVARDVVVDPAVLRDLPRRAFDAELVLDTAVPEGAVPAGALPPGG